MAHPLFYGQLQRIVVGIVTRIHHSDRPEVGIGTVATQGIYTRIDVGHRLLVGGPEKMRALVSEISRLNHEVLTKLAFEYQVPYRDFGHLEVERKEIS